MEDVKAFYSERSMIEKEYATKLTALSTKYFEKKAKMSTTLSVGETPVITPGSLECASLVAWTEIINQTEQIGKERLRLSNELRAQISDQIGGISARFDDLKRKYSVYHDKLVEERDAYYNELKKSKASYDASCEAMEAARLKATKSFDRSKEKANRKLAEREIEMNNEKNYYLIKINVANRIKDKYYHEDVPELLDHLQVVNETRVRMLNDFWTQAITVDKACLERSQTCLDSMQEVVSQNTPTLDSAMFVKHNIGQWSEPTDFYFQESPIWHDDENMITNDIALQYLRRKLEDAHARYAEHARTTEQRAESYRNLQEQQKRDLPDLDSGKISKASYIETLNRYLAALQAITYNETTKLKEAVEIETIEVAAGDKDLNSVAPVAEAKKRKGLRGLFGGSSGPTHHHISSNSNDDGSDLRSIASHSTATSHITGGGGLLSSLRNRKRSGTNATQSSVNDTSIGGSYGSNEQRAKLLYPYTAQHSAELTVAQGEEITIVQPDDGTGWAVGKTSNGTEGLVPASYIELITSDSFARNGNNISRTASVSTTSTSATKKGPQVAPRKGGKKIKYVMALYDYDATNEDEITIRTGDKIVVTLEDQGDGWTEGELNGMRGSFPTSYVKDVE